MGRIYFFGISFALAVLTGGRARTQPVRGSMGFFQMGYINAPQSGAIAQTFVADAFPQLNDFHLYTGGEGWVRIDRFMLGLSASALMTRSTSWQQTHLDRMASLGQFKLGYVLLDNRQWLLFPSFGQGIATSGITLEPASEPARTWVLTNNTMDLALNINKLVVHDQASEHQTKGFWLGIRLGYLVSTKSSLWQELSGAYNYQLKPAYGLNGFYATLAIGGGKFRYGAK